MNYQTFQPHSDLESLVKCYYTLEVNEFFGYFLRQDDKNYLIISPFLIAHPFNTSLLMVIFEEYE